MCEGLGEIAESLAVFGIDLLREHADVVGVAQHPFEQALGSTQIAAARQVLDRPEAANTERPFGCCDGVEPGFVSIEESVPPEARLDPLERSPPPRILGSAITEARHKSEKRSEENTSNYSN